MRELPDLLPDLPPPPGGLARLRLRLDQPRSRPSRALGMVAAAALAAAVLLGLFWPRTGALIVPDDPVIAALSQESRPVEVFGTDVVATRVATTSPTVQYFRGSALAPRGSDGG